MREVKHAAGDDIMRCESVFVLPTEERCVVSEDKNLELFYDIDVCKSNDNLNCI